MEIKIDNLSSQQDFNTYLQSAKSKKQTDLNEPIYNVNNFLIQMQTFDQNQQSPQYRKRKCIVYKPNDFFEAFDFSQHQILSNYENTSQSIMIESLTILIDNIRNSSKYHINEPASPKRQKKDIKKQLYSLKKNFTFKKEINPQECDEDDSTNPQREIKEFVEFEKTGKKPPKSTKKIEYCLQQKEEQPNDAQVKKHQKLLNSLKRLTVSQQFRQLEQDFENPPQFGNNERQTDGTNLLKVDLEGMKNKTISELISESNAKNKSVRNKEYSPIQSQNSEYEMTDYSSNESSNDGGDYEERFTYEDNNPSSILNTIFYPGPTGKNFFLPNNGPKSSIFSDSVHHPPPKLNFKPLLDSPKKSKTKKKRLFINKKKVPRWAQDRNQIMKQFGSEYQKKLREQTNQIFGICIVEDMQTNIIFNRKDQYTRSSTVKWQRNKKFVV